ncbi:unnamed protein product [Heterobilharzia americana]|nr:unnamed protein product [Heterobilharzia americana]
MWLFTNKDSDGLLGSATSLGLSFTHDPVPGFCIDPPNSEPLGSIHGPYNMTWRLLPGQKKKTKEEVTIFMCNLNSNNVSNETGAISSLFQRTVKWMKTLRHPNMLTWLGGTEIASGKLPSEFGYITERVLPLREYLRFKADCGNFNLLSSWGIHQIAKALVFLNDDGKLAHNGVCLDSVFVTTAGEWKLGALDFVGPVNEPPPSVRQTADFANPTDPYIPSDGRLVDSWGLGCLIWEIFNPSSILKDRSQLTESSCIKNIPKTLIPDYRRLIAFRKGGFLANDYVDTLLFLEEIELKDSQEKSTFLRNLATQVTSFPDDVCRHKILPHLVNGLRYGSAGIDALLPVLRLIPLLTEIDFQLYVLPCLLKLFSSPERVTRVRLLEHLPDFIQHIKTKVIETQIFTSISSGFTDTHPIVREATVRAMIHLAPKLSSKLLNENLIKHVTTLQARDEQGGIRTNSTVCLAKLAPHFSTQTQRGPMLSAFLRATRDPFLPNRQAAITALAATQEYYTNDLLAGKLLPCLSFLTTDPEKSIRDDTFRAIHGILDRLEHASENHTIHQSSDNQTIDGNDISNSSHHNKTGTITASGLTQWALSALSFSTRLLPSSSITVETIKTGCDKQVSSISTSSSSSSSSSSQMNKTLKVLEKDDKTSCMKDKLVNSNKCNVVTLSNSVSKTSSSILDTENINEDDNNVNVDGDDDDDDDNQSNLNVHSLTNRNSHQEPVPVISSSYLGDDDNAKMKLNSDWNTDAFFDNFTLQEKEVNINQQLNKVNTSKRKKSSIKQSTKISSKPISSLTTSSIHMSIEQQNNQSISHVLDNNNNNNEIDDWGEW